MDTIEAAGLRAIRSVVIAILLGAQAGCASVPDVEPVLAQAEAGGATPQLLGPGGPLSARQSQAVLTRLAPGPGEAGLLQRHTAVQEAIAETPLIAGNRVRVVRDGPDTFAAMFEAMRGAKSSINLEYYIFEDIESGGERLSDLLIGKRHEGIAVAVIYDSFGSGDTPTAVFDRLAAAGVRLLEYNPIDPLKSRVGYAPNDRDHRKILIVDGALAIVGGVNLSTAYQPGARNKPGTSAEPWRDTDLVIEGPAVAQLQQAFLDHWAQQLGSALDTGALFPMLTAKGSEVVRVVASTHTAAIPRYYVTALTAIRNAEVNIELTTAYFVPTEQELKELKAAARRGIAVRLLLPDRTDSDLATDVGHSRYAELLAAGVKIYETNGIVLHSKTMTVDGVWSVVGSSNFDHRSVLFNDEVDVVVLGSATARQLHELFEQDLGTATEVDPARWAERPLGDRIEQYWARFWQSLL